MSPVSPGSPRTILLTGGGSAGHVIPHLAVLPVLRKNGWTAQYMGSFGGIEREIIGGLMPYYPVSSGKLRRYFDWQNFTDILRVFKGIFQAWRIIRRIKPRVVFSKGGFVSVPAVIGARLCGIPVVLHEADMTPGLANRITLPFVKKICTSFPETAAHLPAGKFVLTGLPVRPEFKTADRRRGLAFLGFAPERPVLAVVGGSLGAERINTVIREALPELLKKFQVAHICGKGKVDEAMEVAGSGYRQFEFIGEALPHVFAAADLIITRAGANTLFEILALQVPHLLIPLSLRASRGDQILNARSFEKEGYSRVLEEEQLDAVSLARDVYELFRDSDRYIQKMKQASVQDAAQKVADVIEAAV